MSSSNLLFSITKKDLKIDAFYAGGPGGQNQNKRKTGCRVTHPASGAVGEARDSRSFDDNKRNAFRRMMSDPRFGQWMRLEVMKYGIGGSEVPIVLNSKEEVIRTYHYPRGTVTDHREGTKYSLKKFMDGDR